MTRVAILKGEREACNCEKWLAYVAAVALRGVKFYNWAATEAPTDRNRELKFNFPQEQKEKNNQIGVGRALRGRNRSGREGGSGQATQFCNFALDSI